MLTFVILIVFEGKFNFVLFENDLLIAKPVKQVNALCFIFVVDF